MSLSQVREMVDYRRRQSNKNIESILSALHELNEPVTSRELGQFLMEKTREKKHSMYYNDEITFTQESVHAEKTNSSMSYRTIQRHLSKLIDIGFVIKENDRYFLSSVGKREHQFRNFASGYGNMALNNIMNCHFPTISSLEENLGRLVEIFGLYIVYCLIEATRLIAAADNNHSDHWHSTYFGDSSNFNKDGKFKEEKLVSLWIKDVFNPLHMLNLFLTAISNAKERSMKTKCNNSKKQEIALEEYFTYYGESDISPSMSNISNNNKRKKNRGLIPAPTTLDLALHRGVSNDKMTTLESMDQNINQIFKFITNYDNEGKLLYHLDNEKIFRLKKLLEKRHPLFLKHLQKTDEYFYSKYHF